MFLTLSVPEITISHHKSQWRKNWKIETKIDLEETFKSLSWIRLVRNIKKNLQSETYFLTGDPVITQKRTKELFFFSPKT